MRNVWQEQADVGHSKSEEEQLEDMCDLLSKTIILRFFGHDGDSFWGMGCPDLIRTIVRSKPPTRQRKSRVRIESTYKKKIYIYIYILCGRRCPVKLLRKSSLRTFASRFRAACRLEFNIIA